MSNILRSSLALLTVSMIAPVALASSGEAGHGGEVGLLPTIQQGIVPMLVTIGVFLVVLAVLGLKVWPSIVSGLKDREEKIRNAIEEAELARDQAKSALNEYEKNLAQARAEAQKMLDDAKTQQQAIAAELRAKSEIELNQMREKAKRDIESAKAAAVIELNTYSASLATDMARKILKRDINAGDQQRLIQESLAEMAGSGRN